MGENSPPPKRRKKAATREILLNAAGELLTEVGMERISTNLICERAGVTPPALYYYFADKFEVVAALGERLMNVQNDALIAWLEKHADGGVPAFAANAEELLRETAAITESMSGGIWVERALHSSPRLEHVRIQSHRFVTDRLTDAVATHLPHMPRGQIWRRMRMLVEFGYMAVEIIRAETDLDPDTVLAEAAEMQKLVMLELLR